MVDGPRRDAEHDAVVDETAEPTVTVCRTSPDNYVFLEVGNRDGWIATDAPVSLSR